MNHSPSDCHCPSAAEHIAALEAAGEKLTTFAQLRDLTYRMMSQSYELEGTDGDPMAIMLAVTENGHHGICMLHGEVHNCAEMAIKHINEKLGGCAMFCIAAPSFVTRIEKDGSRNKIEAVIFSCESHTASEIMFAELDRTSGKNVLGSLYGYGETGQHKGRLTHLLHQQTRN